MLQPTLNIKVLLLISSLINSLVFVAYTESATRYGYSVERRACIQFRYAGCAGNENNFDTREECEAVCVDPCALQPNSGVAREQYTNKDGRSQWASCRK